MVTMKIIDFTLRMINEWSQDGFGKMVVDAVVARPPAHSLVGAFQA